MNVSHIWDKDVDRLREGDVLRDDGGIVHLSSLIQMRWGWPRTAARTAANHLRDSGNPEIDVDAFGFSPGHRGKRLAQQMKLFEEVPTLLADLCAGMIGRANNDQDYADNVIDCVTVVFNNPLAEHGMVREMVNSVACRLGIPTAQVDSEIEIDRDTEPGMTSVRVKNRVEL